MLYNKQTTSERRKNMDMYIDTLSQPILDAIELLIQQQLFEDWCNSNLDEGGEYAEFKVMQFAPDNIKQSYNEFYGYKEGDEYYVGI